MPYPDRQTMLMAGFTAAEIDEDRAKERAMLAAAGFDHSEIDADLGQDIPDSPYTNAMLRNMLTDIKSVDSAVSKELRPLFTLMRESAPKSDDPRAKLTVAAYIAGKSGLDTREVLDRYEAYAAQYFGSATMKPMDHYGSLKSILAPPVAGERGLAKFFTKGRQSPARDKRLDLVATQEFMERIGEEPFLAFAESEKKRLDIGEIGPSTLDLPALSWEERWRNQRMRYAGKLSKGLMEAEDSTANINTVVRAMKAGVRSGNAQTQKALDGLLAMFEDQLYHGTVLLPNGIRKIDRLAPLFTDLDAQKQDREEWLQIVSYAEHITQQELARTTDPILLNLAAGITQNAYMMIAAYAVTGGIGAAVTALPAMRGTGALAGVAPALVKSLGAKPLMSYYAMSKIGESYVDFRNMGIEDPVALPVSLVSGTLYGAIEGIIDVFGMPAGVQHLGDTAVKRFIWGALGEMAEEGFQGLDEGFALRISHELNNRFYGGTADVATIKDIVGDALTAMVESGPTVLGLSALGVSASIVSQHTSHSVQRDAYLAEFDATAKERRRELEAKRDGVSLPDMPEGGPEGGVAVPEGRELPEPFIPPVGTDDAAAAGYEFDHPVDVDVAILTFEDGQKLKRDYAKAKAAGDTDRMQVLQGIAERVRQAQQAARTEPEEEVPSAPQGVPTDTEAAQEQAAEAVEASAEAIEGEAPSADQPTTADTAAPGEDVVLGLLERRPSPALQALLADPLDMAPPEPGPRLTQAEQAELALLEQYQDNPERLLLEVQREAEDALHTGRASFLNGTLADAVDGPHSALKAPGEIIANVSRLFDVPVRGLVTHHLPKQFLGFYNVRTHGIRQRDVRNLTTTAHEVGHAIDRRHLGRVSAKPPSKAIAAELLALGRELYGDVRPDGGYKSEGFAEFVRNYLLGRDSDLEEKAPETVRWFNEVLSESRPDIRAKLDSVRKDMVQWFSGSAVSRVKAMINTKPIKGTIYERAQRLSLWYTTMFVDKFDAMRRILKEAGLTDIPHGEDPFALVTFLSEKASAVAYNAVMVNTTNMAGIVTGKGLKQILAEIESIGDFIVYMVARRVLDLHHRGINPGISIEDAREVVELFDSEQYRRVAEEVTDWNGRVLDYLVEAGGLDEDAAKKMRAANPVYIPFFRAFAEGEFAKGRAAGSGLFGTGKAIFNIKGSGRELIDPLESMISQAERIYEVAHRAIIARSLYNLEQKYEGLAKWIWRIPPPKQSVRFSANQIKNDVKQIITDRMEESAEGRQEEAALAEDEGRVIDEGAPIDETLEAAAGLVEDAFGDSWDKMLTVYINAPQFLGKENVVSLVVDGKQQWFEVAPELYRMLKSLDTYTLPPLLNVLFGKPTRALRLGATGLNPAFSWLRNPWKDVLGQSLFSQRTKPGEGFVGIGKAVAHELIPGVQIESVRHYEALGGRMTGQIGNDRVAAQHLRGEMLPRTASGKTFYTLSHPVQVIRGLFGITELGPRVQEFEKALKHWEGVYGRNSFNAVVAAFNEAQDITVNFTRSGYAGRALNQMIPFWNAGMQSMDRTYRAFRDDPVGTSFKAVSMFTLPALTLWWTNRDKEWYKNLSAYEKFNYLHVEVGDEILRLPVPFLPGHLFMSLPVAIMESMYRDDPDVVIDTLSAIMKEDNPFWLGPSDIAGIGPFLDVLKNQDFAGRPIVPRSVENKQVNDRYTHYTTETMKQMAKGYNAVFARFIGRPVAPAELEHIVNALSGGLYRRTIPAAERLAIQKKARKDSNAWGDMPVIGTLFVREPAAPRAQMEAFYRERSSLSEKAASKNITWSEGRRLKRMNTTAAELREMWSELAETEDERERAIIWTRMRSKLE